MSDTDKSGPWLTKHGNITPTAPASFIEAPRKKLVSAQDSEIEDKLDDIFERKGDLVAYGDLYQTEELEGIKEELAALISQQCNQARIDERKKVRKPFGELMAGLFAIDYYINKPFPDDPRWTPKSRFIEPRVQDVLATLKTRDTQAKETEEA
ncbi:hypothetical protein QFZ60_001543 [Arthrobacter sp. B2I5]|uniref:hypothetical protein n=1 Tax=Arthrobacter sp. B2I5 TaxID=3042266 RepID=UPI00278166F5|nr:hypothetical protein [Arthrobacter sp. B2I5]MDQ0825370.1 hypothetical protein [Arthrobacter sp. B2I5]